MAPVDQDTQNIVTKDQADATQFSQPNSESFDVLDPASEGTATQNNIELYHTQPPFLAGPRNKLDDVQIIKNVASRNKPPTLSGVATHTLEPQRIFLRGSSSGGIPKELKELKSRRNLPLNLENLKKSDTGARISKLIGLK